MLEANTGTIDKVTAAERGVGQGLGSGVDEAKKNGKSDRMGCGSSCILKRRC
jgi:hypothetical protein